MYWDYAPEAQYCHRRKRIQDSRLNRLAKNQWHLIDIKDISPSKHIRSIPLFSSREMLESTSENADIVSGADTGEYSERLVLVSIDINKGG